MDRSLKTMGPVELEVQFSAENHLELRESKSVRFFLRLLGGQNIIGQLSFLVLQDKHFSFNGVFHGKSHNLDRSSLAKAMASIDGLFFHLRVPPENIHTAI